MLEKYYKTSGIQSDLALLKEWLSLAQSIPGRHKFQQLPNNYLFVILAKFKDILLAILYSLLADTYKQRIVAAFSLTSQLLENISIVTICKDLLSIGIL